MYLSWHHGFIPCRWCSLQAQPGPLPLHQNSWCNTLAQKLRGRIVLSLVLNDDKEQMVLGLKEKVLLSNHEKIRCSMLKKSNPRPKKLKWQASWHKANTCFWECQCRQRWIQKILSTIVAAQRSTQSWLSGPFSLLTSSMMDERAAICTQLSKLQKNTKTWSKYCTAILYHNRNSWHDEQKHSLWSWRRRSYINCCWNAGWLSPASSAVVWILSTAS